MKALNILMGWIFWNTAPVHSVSGLLCDGLQVARLLRLREHGQVEAGREELPLS